LEGSRTFRNWVGERVWKGLEPIDAKNTAAFGGCGQQDLGGQAGRVGKLSHKRLKIDKLEVLSFLGDSGPFSGGLENSRLDFCFVND
jgi:hypothetical protein